MHTTRPTPARGEERWRRGAIGLLVAVALCLGAGLSTSPRGATAQDSGQQLATWEDLELTTQPSPRDQAAMAYDPLRNEVVLFGGRNPGANGETWIWNGSVWDKVEPVTTPPPRFGAGLAFDGERRQLILFGGESGGGTPVPPDTWAWNGTDWEKVSTSGPTARTRHMMARDDQRVLLFGGFDTRVRGDTWVWSGGGWNEVRGAGPPPRAAAAMAYDERSKQVVLFGGFDGAKLADTWTWQNGAWNQVLETQDPDLTARDGSAAAFDQKTGRVVMFGGHGRSDDLIDDEGDLDNADLDETWTWNGTTRIWENQPDQFPDDAPRARSGASMAADPGGTVILFGGRAPFPIAETHIWRPADPPPTTTTSTSTSTSSTSTTSTTLLPDDRPRVTRVVPEAGPESGGTEVTIHGIRLNGARSVRFGDALVDCSDEACEATPDGSQLEVVTPRHPPGTVHVLVTTEEGVSPAVGEDEFTFHPHTGPRTGGGFGPGAGGFTGGEPAQPAPPGGFSSVPSPGTGFVPGASTGFVPGTGTGVVPGTGTNPGPSLQAGAPGVVAPPIATPGAAGGVPPPPPGPGASAGLIPPGGPHPPVIGAAPYPGPGPGAAPHYRMVGLDGSADPPGGPAAAAVAVAGGLFAVFCFSSARRQPAGPMAAPAGVSVGRS